MKTNVTIGIIGCGNVGSTVAYTLYKENVGDLVLLNHNKVRAYSNVLDISDTLLDPSHHSITWGDYTDVSNFDIIINCAGNSNLLRNLDRNSEFSNSQRIADDIISNLNKWNFRGLFINVMNPCDEVTYLFKDLDIPNNKIIGTGTLLETVRLRRLIYDDYNFITDSYIVGNHGVNNAIVTRDLLTAFSTSELESVLNKVHNKVWDIYSGKGFTNFGIANTVACIIHSILCTHSELCVSTLLGDTYDINSRCVSVPCILSLDGVKVDNIYKEVDIILKKIFKE